MTAERRLEKKELVALNSRPFDFFTGHVQGMTVAAGSLFLSSVHSEERVGLLFRLTLPALRLDGSATLYREPESLECVAEIDVDEHVGAVAYDGGETIICATWDAARFLFLDRTGRVLASRENCTDIAYQDMELRDGLLNCSGINRNARGDGRVDIFTLGGGSGGGAGGPVLSLVSSIHTPRISSSKSVSHEGMTFIERRLAFLPEDYPGTTLYTALTE